MPPKKSQAPTKAAPPTEGPPSRPVAYIDWSLLPSAVPPPNPPAPPAASGLDVVDEDLAPLTANTEARLVGRFEIELMTDLVPKACENFKQFCLGVTIQGDKKAKVAESKTLGYKDTRLLRATSDMIQCGDVSHRPDGKGSECIHGGSTFEDEQLGVVSHSQRGVISYVNSGANTNGSQFCITLKEATFLDQHLVSFGRLLPTEQNEQTLSLMEEIIAEVKEGVAELEAAAAAEENAADNEDIQNGAKPFGYYDSATSRFNPADCPLIITACGISDQTVLIPQPAGGALSQPASPK